MKQLSLLLITVLISLFGTGQNAYLTSALINSCNGTCSEGDNEILFGNTGNGTLNVTPANLQIFYGTTSPASTSYTDALTTNPTTTSNLNAAAGCTLFLEAVGSTIPANASFVVVRNSICTSALNWTGLCGAAPIYIIYSTDASWLTGGNFANGTGTNRFFRSVITTSAGTSTISYTYNLPAAFGNDGAFANWTSAGGNAVLYGDNDCSITPTALSISIESFEMQSDQGLIIWKVKGNEQIDHFVLEYSELGEQFEPIHLVMSNWQSDTASYSVTCAPEYLKRNGYFRLIVFDSDGRYIVHDKLIRYTSSFHPDYDLHGNELINNGRTAIIVYSVNGTKITQLEPEKSITLPSQQIVIIQTENSHTRIFIP